MPTFITHAFVGAAAGAVVADKETPKRFWYFAVICAMLPDADLITYQFGYSFSDFLGHNGFFHSLVFALAFSYTISFIFFRINGFLSKDWWKYFIFFFFIIAVHGVMDAMIEHDPGVALLSPVDNSKYLLPWTPLKPSTLGIKEFFGPIGWNAIKSELTYIWLPMAVVALVSRAFRFIKSRFGLVV